MTDSSLPRPDPRDDRSDNRSDNRSDDRLDDRVEGLLRDALAAPTTDRRDSLEPRNSERARSRPDEVPAPDASRVAGHFAGVGDGDLLDAAAEHESVRQLLAEIALVVEEDQVVAEDDAESADDARASDAGPVRRSAPRCSEGVRSRAIAAFREGARRAGSPDVPAASRATLAPARIGVPRASGVRSTTGSRWARIAMAASILVVAGVGLLVSGHRAEAAVLSLDGFDRVDAAGAVMTTGPGRLTMGDEVASRAGERVALRLADGSRVVFGDGSRLSVGCDAPCDGQCGGPVFDVVSGGVAVAASNSTGVARPVSLRVPSEGRMDVLEGAARMERGPAGATSLLLRADARVRWSPVTGSSREIVGPATVRLDAEGGVGTATSDAVAFHDLEYFGGVARRVADEIRVGARRWRIRADETTSGPEAHGSRDDAGGAPVIRFDLDAGATGRVAWPADAPVFAARRLEVRLRATADSVSSLIVRLEGVEGAERTIAIRPGAAFANAPRAATYANAEWERVVFELPPSFGSTSAAPSDLVLSWSAPGAGVSVWFEGASFLASSGAAAPPGPGVPRGK